MTLARLRVAEQLRLSEESLAIQVEKLNRFEEALRDQIAEGAAAMARANQQRKLMMRTIAADVRSQINGANELMNRMRRIRERVDANIDDNAKQASTDQVVSSGQTTQPGECNNTNQVLYPAAPPQAETPTPTPESQASPQPSQSAPVAQQPT
jgi:predicted DNA-binding helix-hairpin-helix protein